MSDIDNGDFMIFAEIQEVDGEKLLVIRLIAPKDPNQETPEEVPKFNIYIDESWNNRDYITPALTDITNRACPEDQITLMSPCEKTPDHLTVRKVKKIEAAHAATTPSETLVLVTSEPDERDHYLTVLNTKTGQEFKVHNSIEFLDALADFIRPLKNKTMANSKIQLFTEDSAELVPIGQGATVDRSGSEHSIFVNDLASEERRTLYFKFTGKILKLTFSYEDTLLGRRISGGQSIQCLTP